MHWPHDHPVMGDERLARLRAAADALCPDACLGRVLRHVPGRRIALRVETADGPGVLKLFASPRARGNQRRLGLLARTAAADVVPRAWGCDESGHVGLTSWRSGVVLNDADDAAFVASAGAVGVALRRLHSSGADLDRGWSIDDETALLERFTPGPLDTLVERARELAPRLRGEPRVSAHRDFHPKQVVVDGELAGLIDLDDAALAPPGLDVGNFLAHLTQDAVLDRRPVDVIARARSRFVAGYGPAPGGTSLWEWLALVRLSGLAERRHRRKDWAVRLMEFATREMPK